MPRRPSGRTPGSPPNREAILEAAKALFAERGYDRATIRSIAARAGVDPALVHHYFGTKDALMSAAFELPFNPRDIAPRLAGVPRDLLGSTLVRLLLQVLQGRPEAPATMVGLLRSAATSEAAARMLREYVSGEILGTVFAAVDLDRPRLRAALAASQVVGLVMARHVVRLPALVELSDDDVVAIYGPTIQRYLVGELP